MFSMSDEKWNSLSEAEKDAFIKRELEAAMYHLDMIEAGLWARWGGLIVRLPTGGHDCYGEGI